MTVVDGPRIEATYDVIRPSPKPLRRSSAQLEAGRPVDAEAAGIAADSLAPRRRW